ncbi:hypothetical protein N9U42_02475 [Luminiphilus sp.]|nr:hypothetical protein [Luminiphilus sp.]MDA9711213.1 hypothetical protein [Luminiphilus sp.]
MKKKVLPLAVGAATAVTMSAAHAAMYVNDKGMGETLIFPFYSAESGNNTAIHVVNTTAGTKAVKVRIMEAENSQEVLDFNLYMSPADHFSFGIVADGDGAKIVTGDNSCTVPAIPADGQPFVSFKYDGTIGAGDSSEGDDDGVGAFDNTGIERTRVGYVEVIEMGQLDPDAAPALDTTPASDTYTPINAVDAITHGADGVPANCDLLVEAWSLIDDVPGTWYAEADDNVTQATAEFLTNWAGGGLYGYARVLNVAEGSAFGYDALAIASHVAAGASGSAMHYRPGSIYPNFGDDAMDTEATINVNGEAITLDFDGTVYPADSTNRVQALNSLIMATAIHNDFVTDSSINAETDWITTFPTKHFHINGVTEGVEPFATLWNGQSACEDTNLAPIDREEQTPVIPDEPTTSAGPDFSPAPPPGAGPAAPASTDVPLCYESTVVMMAETSAVKAENSVGLGVNASLHADDGWATMSFDPASLDDDIPFSCDVDGEALENEVAEGATPCDRVIDAGTHTVTGLPVVGFAVQKYVNLEATPGGAGYYAMATAHKTSVTVSEDN